jgi:predicted lipoprotein with Yx(FWY)xxD motif
MQSKLLLGAAAAFMAVIVSACGDTTPSATAPSPSPAASPSSPATAGATIMVATDSKLGAILVDGNGKTVYLFVADKGTASTCYTSCATVWPPVLTTGAPAAGTGATASLLGTTTRTDGKVEVTYAGHPLYYFIQDKKAGDTTGQGVNGFGGLWWVLSPAGAAITTK